MTQETAKQESRWKKPVPKWVTCTLWVILGIVVILRLLPSKVTENIGYWIGGVLKHFLTSTIVIIAFLAMTLSDGFSMAMNARQQVVIPDVPAVETAKQPVTDTLPYMFDTSTNQNQALSSAIRVSQNGSGSYLMVIPASSVASWFTNDGVVYVTTTNGGVYPVQDLSLCGALIIGGIIIIVGGPIIYKLAMCAKRKLYGTNAPSTNAPPNSGGNNTHSSGNSTFTGNSLSGSGLPLLLPEGLTLTLINMDDNVAISDTSTAGWLDWQGNLVTLQFSMVMSPTNMAVGTNSCYVQSSTSMRPGTWVDESFTITGWVSSVSASVHTNLLTVTYDQYGNGIGTNWYSLHKTNSDYIATQVDALNGIPQRTNSQLFFRAEVK